MCRDDLATGLQPCELIPRNYAYYDIRRTTLVQLCQGLAT